MMRRLHSDEERNIPATCTIKLERGGERKKDGITVIFSLKKLQNLYTFMVSQVRKAY